jgi:hypothetical protein
MPRSGSSLALIALTAAAGALLAAPADAAPAARSVDVPTALARQIALAKPRTDLPVLLPDRIRAEGPVFPQLIVATTRRWTIDLALARNCRQATACFFASFSGRRSVPFGGLRVGLHRGITGPLHPPALWRLVRAAQHRVAARRRDLRDPGQGPRAGAQTPGRAGQPGDRRWTAVTCVMRRAAVPPPPAGVA